MEIRSLEPQGLQAGQGSLCFIKLLATGNTSSQLMSLPDFTPKFALKSPAAGLLLNLRYAFAWRGYRWMTRAPRPRGTW